MYTHSKVHSKVHSTTRDYISVYVFRHQLSLTQTDTMYL